MNTTKKESKQTAAEAYAERGNDIGALLDLISQELKVHAEDAAKTPKNWGFAGDLGHIRESLKEILQSLVLRRNKCSETEFSEFIEQHLQKLREE